MAKNITEKRLNTLTTRDWKREGMTRLDRIREAYLGNGELSKEDERYRKLLEQINSMLSSYYSRGEVLKLILKMPDFKVKRTAAQDAINNAIELFGDINESNKKGLTAIITERLLRLASKAEKLGEIELSGKMLERLAKINGLPEDNEGKLTRRRRIKISYSTNPQVLHEAEEEIYE